MAADFATILGFVVLVLIKALALLPTLTEPLLKNKSCGFYIHSFVFCQVLVTSVAKFKCFITIKLLNLILQPEFL